MTFSPASSVVQWLWRPATVLRPPFRMPHQPKQPSGSLLINPAYAGLLDRSGLRSAVDFLLLREEIRSGHPDRQVSRVMLANGVIAYLKREHRVPWKERLRNWWHGF